MDIFPDTYTGTELVTAVSDAISANIAVVLVVFGAMVGLRYVIRFVNHSVKGRL